MKKILITALLVLAATCGCKKYYPTNLNYPVPDWTEATHSNSVDPNYDVVFEEGVVHRVDMKISQADWTTMQNDLKANIKPGQPISDSWDPVTVPCSFFYNGKEWYKVGVRYKGNSSLKVCVSSNIKKYSFKLEFDHFEDQWASIKNQRFYGFKELNLTNGFSDNSLMREKTGADLFREFGVKAPRAVFCEVWVDCGTGPSYFGLYTLEEIVEDAVIKTQFTDGGNLYKPEGLAASLANGTFNTSQLYKQTNDDGDYSDIRNLYDIINSEARVTNYSNWKTALENCFDVNAFLKWLAANTVMQNWDTYGKQTHNYYLYNNPANSKLTWIPWDNNECLSTGKNGGALGLSLDMVGPGWPLIRYILDDPDYYSAYKTYVSQFATTVFSIASFQARVEAQADLIRSKVNAEITGYTFLKTKDDFAIATDQLKQHVQNRADSVFTFLAK